jgi:glutathione S-transferase
MTPRLVTVPFSHFCEKARWALERAHISFTEDGHLPMLHWWATRRAGGGRTVPVLVTGERLLDDSTDIVAWAHRDAPDPPDALALEDDFDRQLGPATRRWAYAQLLPNRDAVRSLAGAVPRWESATLRVVRPLAFAMMRRGMNITPEGVARSLTKIEDTFARVGALLADGRRYLTGDRFTVADLTFASLAAPALAPAEHPYMHGVDLFPAEARAQIDRWRDTPAGQFGLRMYAEER